MQDVFQRIYKLSFPLLMAGISIQAQASCGTTSCSINTDWNEHSTSHPGWSTDLRYSYSNAEVLRTGNTQITADPTAAPYNAGIEAENLRTINQVINTSLDYTYDEHWGLLLQIPYVMRDHTHSIGNTDPALVTTESFTANAIGDIKTIGRYRWNTGLDNRSAIGVKFGLKLNTGRKDFLLNTGVLPGEATLQPGNASTDLILGAFWNQSTPGSDWSWFAQGTIQSSIASSSIYRPGDQLNLDAGTRYVINSVLSGLLQVNMQWNEIDSGSAAALSPLTGEASSGMRSIAISPGLSYALDTATQLYGMVQLPLYQYVNGEQLTASYTASLGISHHY